MFYTPEFAKQVFHEISLSELAVEAPYLSVVGPLGSGEREAVQGIKAFLLSLPEYADPCQHIVIDFDTQPPFNEDEAHYRLLDACYVALEVPKRRRGVREIALSTQYFRKELRTLLANFSKGIVFYLEGLDAVCSAVVNSVGNSFRQLHETDDEYPELRRVGLVWSGALSFFDIRRDINSAFTMSRTIVLPILDKDLRSRAISEELRKRDIPLDARLIEWLEKETGAEPGFLRPLLQSVSMQQSSVELFLSQLQTAVERLCGMATPLPELHNLGLQLVQDDELRNVVEALLKRGRIAPRSAPVDIDRYQISGALIAEGAAGESMWRMRNDMVARYSKALLRTLGKDPAGTPFLRTGGRNKEGFTGLLQAAIACDTRMKAGQDVWDLIAVLENAWRILISPEVEDVQLFCPERHGTGVIRLSAKPGRLCSMLSPEEIDEPIYSHMKSANLAPLSISTGNETVFLTPVSWEGFTVWIMVRGAKVRERPIAEVRIYPWTRLVKKYSARVVKFTLTGVGAHMISAGIDAAPWIAQGRTVATQRVRGTETSARVLLLPHGGYFAGVGAAISFEGGIPGKALDRFNNEAENAAKQMFRAGTRRTLLNKLGEDVERFVRELDDKLLQKLVDVARYDRLVVSSNVEMMTFPLELLPVGKRPLLLERPIIRRLFGYETFSQGGVPYNEILRRIVTRRDTFNCVLVGSAPTGDLPNIVAELSMIERFLRGWAKDNALPIAVSTFAGDRATYDNVRRALRRSEDVHVFHYAGHTEFNAAEPDRSALVLQSKDGAGDHAACEKFRALIEEARVWFLFLNSCFSASTISRSSSLHVNYAGLVDAAMSARVPNMICHRWAVSDRSAAALAKAFYSELFRSKGGDLEAALFNSRKAVVREEVAIDAAYSAVQITNIWPYQIG